MTTPGTGVGVFGCTVDAVYRLCPEVPRVTDPNQSPLPTPITEDTVAAWIVEISDMLAASIGEWELLTGNAATRISRAAAGLVANGAASYLEAARYPTMTGPNSSSYAGELWSRYTQGIPLLAGMVHTEITSGGVDVIIDTEQTGPFGAFPDPYFTDGDSWSPWVEACDPRSAW